MFHNNRDKVMVDTQEALLDEGTVEEKQKELVSDDQIKEDLSSKKSLVPLSST